MHSQRILASRAMVLLVVSVMALCISKVFMSSTDTALYMECHDTLHTFALFFLNSIFKTPSLLFLSPPKNLKQGNLIESHHVSLGLFWMPSDLTNLRRKFRGKILKVWRVLTVVPNALLYFLWLMSFHFTLLACPSRTRSKRLPFFFFLFLTYQQLDLTLGC